MAKNKKTLKKIEKHRRVNDILLGPLERPAIAWLVEHMPHWVTPDHLTILGFGASILTGVSYALTDIDKNYLWLANLGFILNWVGDSLDGNLARYRKIERPKYGFFIDHTIDAASEVIIFIGIGLSPYVDLTLALLALVGYLCMANLVYITTSVEGVFKISYGRLGPTEIRALAILANITVYFIGNPQISLPWINLSLYNLIVSVIVALLVIFFVNTTVKQAIRFEREDRAKWLEKVNAFEKREPTEKNK